MTISFEKAFVNKCIFILYLFSTFSFLFVNLKGNPRKFVHNILFINSKTITFYFRTGLYFKKNYIYEVMQPEPYIQYVILYVCIYTYMWICVCMYIHTYMYMQTYTHTETNIMPFGAVALCCNNYCHKQAKIYLQYWQDWIFQCPATASRTVYSLHVRSIQRHLHSCCGHHSQQCPVFCLWMCI